MNSLNQYLGTHQDRFIQELFDFLRIPSISTISSHNKDVEKAAIFVKDQLQKAGTDTAYLMTTKGHPLVYGEKIIDQDLPTVLVYGHYDVQPVDPLDLWETPPFEPDIRDGKIYARGASDDKGQVYMHIKAFEAMVKTGTLTCNVKFLIEGEEESESTAIQSFLQKKENLDLIAADVVLVSDTALLSMETPSIDISLRGIAAFEIEVQGPKRDLHSGAYGGAVANPAEMLCKLLSQLKDDHGRILIPGFYDDVAELSAEERKALDDQPFDLAQYKKEVGVDEVFGEKGYSTIERLGVRPTFEVNGINSGYTGEGIKTVLPAKASAKITIRTVAHQDTPKLAQQVKDYITSLAPQGVRVSIKSIHGNGEQPFMTNPESQGIKAACQAFETVWGKRPLLTRQGGSIPILATFQEALGIDVVNLGFGLDSDHIHSPNEHFGVANFAKGIETIAAFYQAFAKKPSN